MSPRHLTKTRFLAGKRGFTLIEVLIAMFLLVFALLGGAALTLGVMNGNTQSDQVSTASILSQNKLEEMQQLGYPGTPFTNSTVTEDYNTINNHAQYKRVTVTSVNSPGPARKKITVTVYWNSDEQSVTLQSILAKEK
jgi:prepilin-type N-terminal cleavage/methylation domain-containing protein